MHQKELLDFALANDTREMGIREIGRTLGISNPQLVKHHMVQLFKKGLLSKEQLPSVIASSISEQNDSIKIIDDKVVRIPFLGDANCGPATLVAEGNYKGYLLVSKSMLKGNIESLFAVRAVGDSMNLSIVDGKHISDGDYVIIDKSKNVPTQGSIVLSIIGENANIKEYHEDDVNNQIVLISRSEKKEDYPPIYIKSSDELSYFINGTAVTVLKKPLIDSN